MPMTTDFEFDVFLSHSSKERRFIPLRLDDAPIKASLAQFLYIRWLQADRELEYPRLLQACRPLVKPPLSLHTPTHLLPRVGRKEFAMESASSVVDKQARSKQSTERKCHA